MRNMFSLAVTLSLVAVGVVGSTLLRNGHRDVAKPQQPWLVASTWRDTPVQDASSVVAFPPVASANAHRPPFRRVPHHKAESKDALSSLLLFPYNLVRGFVRGVAYIVEKSGVADDIEEFTHSYPRVVVIIPNHKQTNANILKTDWCPNRQVLHNTDNEKYIAMNVVYQDLERNLKGFNVM